MNNLVKLAIVIMSLAFPLAALLGYEQSALQPTFKCLSLTITGSVLSGVYLWKTKDKLGWGHNLVAFIIYALFLGLAAQW